MYETSAGYPLPSSENTTEEAEQGRGGWGVGGGHCLWALLNSQRL